MTRDSARRRSALSAASDRAQEVARPPRRAAARTVAVLLGALVWLLVGCSGLLWTIAFTTDAGSMTVGLAVWVFCFVVPSTLATVIAYQLEERSPVDGGERAPPGRYAAGD